MHALLSGEMILGKKAVKTLGPELAERIVTVLVALKAAGVFYNGQVDTQGDPVPRYTYLEGMIPQLFGLPTDYPLGFASGPGVDRAITDLIFEVDRLG